MKFKKLLATAITMSLPVMAFAGTTEYDGIWDFHFECVVRRGDWGTQVVVFNGNQVQNGLGHFYTTGPRGPVELVITMRDNKVSLTRVATVLENLNWRWTLKMEGEITTPSNFQLKGVNWPDGADGALASDCTLNATKH